MDSVVMLLETIRNYAFPLLAKIVIRTSVCLGRNCLRLYRIFVRRVEIPSVGWSSSIDGYPSLRVGGVGFSGFAAGTEIMGFFPIVRHLTVTITRCRFFRPSPVVCVPGLQSSQSLQRRAYRTSGGGDGAVPTAILCSCEGTCWGVGSREGRKASRWHHVATARSSRKIILEMVCRAAAAAVRTAAEMIVVAPFSSLQCFPRPAMNLFCCLFLLLLC